MPWQPLTLEQIATRRASRRREVRRRRIGLLVTVCALLALVAGVLVGRGGEGDASADDRAPPGASGKSSSTRSAPVRGRLGSGKSVTLAFAGDTHFESPVRERLAASPASVLASIAPVLERADVSVVNLETAVTERGSPEPKEFTFRAPASAFTALRAGGVDVANLANNHGMDYGEEGLRDSLSAAEGEGVAVIGAGVNGRRAYAPYETTVHGERLAIIGATQVLDDKLIARWTAGPDKPGLASAKNEPRLVRAVREARITSDTVVVFLHWGAELATCPTRAQKRLARVLVEAGADIVVGSHAHVLLGAGRLGNAFVAYGLGNFVFYASRALTSRSGVLEVTVTGRRIDGYRWVPARISGGIPRPLDATDSPAAVRSWRALRACTPLRP